MKKIFLSIVLFCLLSIIFVPFPANATCGDGSGIVNCGCAADGSDACTIGDFFTMLAKIYDFIVKMIATPLAVIALTVGGIMILISAGNPNLAGTGKKILYAGIIGLVLVFCSWLIINFILCTVLGYSSGGSCNWSSI